MKSKLKFSWHDKCIVFMGDVSNLDTSNKNINHNRGKTTKYSTRNEIVVQVLPPLRPFNSLGLYPDGSKILLVSKKHSTSKKSHSIVKTNWRSSSCFRKSSLDSSSLLSLKTNTLVEEEMNIQSYHHNHEIF